MGTASVSTNYDRFLTKYSIGLWKLVRPPGFNPTKCLDDVRRVMAGHLVVFTFGGTVSNESGNSVSFC